MTRDEDEQVKVRLQVVFSGYETLPSFPGEVPPARSRLLDAISNDGERSLPLQSNHPFPVLGTAASGLGSRYVTLTLCGGN